MSAEEGKAVIRRWIEAGNKQDIETGVSLWADAHQESIRTSMIGFTEAFPDFQLTIKELIAEGNKVAGWWEFNGTHLGTFRDIPATGKRVTWMGVDLYTVENGKIVSLVRGADSLSLLQQLGVSTGQ
jgi:steroid delta-isomerase-like uncharacterized protein